MQPVFVDQLALIVVLVVTVLVWRVTETVLDIRSVGRLRRGVQRQDRGSRLILACFVVLGLFFGTIIAFQVPATIITGARTFLFWVGILLMYVGIALRVYAVNRLGAFFTTTLATAPGQTVIETGPYRLIRHPSYTGFLITLFGYALSLTNWLSLLVIMGCALIGFGYRIRVEERVLQEQLGQPYQEYMRRTKRLIPFVV